MTDDIVTRLRDEYCDGGYAAPNCGDCVQCEAADEIERLNKEIRQLKHDLSMWTRIGHMVFTHNEGCLPGCRRACMCTCGFEHYAAQVAQEARRD